MSPVLWLLAATVAVFVTAVHSGSTDCPQNQFWDVGLDRCEECGPYCRDAVYRKMVAECKELCPAFVQFLKAAAEPNQGLSGVTVAVIITGVVVVVGASVVVAVVLRRRRQAAQQVRRVSCPGLPRQETKYGVPQATPEPGRYSRMHPLTPSGSSGGLSLIYTPPGGLPRGATVV